MVINLSTLLMASLRPAVRYTVYFELKNNFCLWLNVAAINIMKDLDLSQLPSQTGKTILITGGMFKIEHCRSA
jgi:hypothetical protein